MAENNRLLRVGFDFADDFTVSDSTLNLLFLALILTMLGVYIGGNLPYSSQTIMLASGKVLLCNIGLICSFYTLSRILHSLLWGLAFTFLCILSVVYARLEALCFLIYLFFFISALYCFRNLKVERKIWSLVIIMSIIGAAMALGVSRSYTTFDMMPRLHAGDVAKDTLYHVSIAAMIKNYGVVSTGLNGLVETPYHALSHALMAGISILSDVSVIEVYGIAPWLLFAPLLLFSFTALCAILDRDELLSLPIVWSIGGLLLTIAPILFGRWALWGSYFVSESYLVSLIFFIFGLALLFKRSLTLSDLLLVIVLTGFISSAKATVGLVYVILMVSRLVLLKENSMFRDLLALFLSSTVFFVTVMEPASTRVSYITLSPFNFIQIYSYLGEYLSALKSALHDEKMPSLGLSVFALLAVVGYIVFHYVATWAVLLIALYRYGIKGLVNRPISVYLLAGTAIGLLAGLFCAIEGGSAYYFSNVAFFIALPILTCYLSYWWKVLEISDRLTVLLIAIVVFLVSMTIFYIKNTVLTKNTAYSIQNSTIDSLLRIKSGSELSVVYQADVELLQHNPVALCSSQPFLFPAVSERPWIGVIQKNGCSYEYYGYDRYGIKDNEWLELNSKILPGMLIRNYSE